MIETGDPAEIIIEMGGYKMVSDRDQIAAAVAAAIAANPQAIDELKREEEARGRQGLPPRPGDEADRRQGQPRSRRRTARGQLAELQALIGAFKQAHSTPALSTLRGPQS